MHPYQDSIEKYLSGKLDQAAETAFEEKLKADPDLKEAYELEVAARKVVRVAGRKNLRSRLEQMEKEQEAKLIRPYFHIRRMMLIAALVAGVYAGYWLIQSRVSAVQPDYFAEHFEPYRSPANERGKENSEKNAWDAARDLYRHGRYDKAVLALESAIPNKLAPDYLLQFYLGVSLLAQENPQPGAAIIALEKVLTVNNTYRQQAKWYLALAHLKLGEVEQAIPYLEELVLLRDYKKKEAKIILESLK